jgi:hypothetical protein
MTSSRLSSLSVDLPTSDKRLLHSLGEPHIASVWATGHCISVCCGGEYGGHIGSVVSWKGTHIQYEGHIWTSLWFITACHRAMHLWFSFLMINLWTMCKCFATFVRMPSFLWRWWVDA